MDGTKMEGVYLDDAAYGGFEGGRDYSSERSKDCCEDHHNHGCFLLSCFVLLIFPVTPIVGAVYFLFF